jgi:hypothetical protein
LLICLAEFVMKINNSTRFPHPVLSEVTGDYQAGSFSIFIGRTTENPVTGNLNMEYTVSLDEPKLKLKMDNGVAIPGVFITCLDVYYSALHPLEELTGSLAFAPGKLKGRVSIRPFLWAGDGIKNFSSRNLHEDYNNALWDFSTGSILAMGSEYVIHVGHEKLAPMESIFSLAVSDEVEEGEIKVDTGNDKITILGSNDTFHAINLLRNTKQGRDILLNSVYLPVVMEVLSQLREDDGTLAGKRWHSVFTAKCTHLKIDLQSGGSILEDAQKLLKLPIKRIMSLMEVNQ